MAKKKDFIMVPRGIDKDPRLQPWMNQDYVNRREVLWAVERMMDRLSLQPKKRLTIQELTMGLYNSHLPYRLLKDIIIGSGFFDYNDAGVLYNWDLFVYDSEVEEEPQSPNCSPIVPQLTPNSTCARTSSSANRRVKYIETEKETENISHTKKKKKKRKVLLYPETAMNPVFTTSCSTIPSVKANLWDGAESRKWRTGRDLRNVLSDC